MSQAKLHLLGKSEVDCVGVFKQNLSTDEYT